MKHTKQFIEDAMEGGFEGRLELGFEWYMKRYPRVLLSPEAWQAVGKTRGWEEGKVAMWRSEKAKMTVSEFFMHNFVECLFEEQSIEEALEAISK